MLFNNEFLEKVKEQVDLAELVGKKVSWDAKKSKPSKGDFWAPCPFHSEKTASFHVDNEKGFYYCFGCHAKGNCFKFVQETENISFYDAVVLLANENNIQIPHNKKEDKEKNDYKNRLINVMRTAVNFYKSQLNSIKGVEAKNYLENRNLKPKTIEDFEIGYATKMTDSLYKFLKSQKVSDKEIIDTGLCILSEKDSIFFDRFRNRIIFPIYNNMGDPIAFGGRSLDVKSKAKYLNSPETDLFNKSVTLYNFKNARNNIKKNQEIILVEGYMDVILLSQEGIKTAVATLGTAINEKQIEMIWKISKEPRICFDGDTAGIRASRKVMELVLPLISAKKSLRFCNILPGKDPDDIISQEGVDKMKEIIESSVPLIEVFWANLIEGKSIDSPERKTLLDNEINYNLNKINDPNLRFHFKTDIINKRKILLNNLYQPYENNNINQRKKTYVKNQNLIKKTFLHKNDDEKLLEYQNIEGGILLGLINHPNLIESFEDKISKFQFSSKQLNYILDCILNITKKNENYEKDLFLKKLSDQVKFDPILKIKKFSNLHLNPKILKNSNSKEAKIVIIELIKLYEEMKKFEKEIEIAKKNINSEKSIEIEKLIYTSENIKQLKIGSNNLFSKIDEIAKKEQNELQLLIKNKIWKKVKK